MHGVHFIWISIMGNNNFDTDFRVGHGYDVHKIVRPKMRPLIICGTEIMADFSLEAHSDGDVALHALADALLGAIGLGDIGQHFPDTDVTHKGRNSMTFIDEIVAMLHARCYVISNVDMTIIAQKPKLISYMSKMKQTLARRLLVSESRVNIKATTSEKLGFAGREEGVCAHAVVLIKK